MFSGRGIDPFTRRTLRGILEPHEHRAARIVADIADLPVTPLTSASRKIVATHRLGFTAKTVCQIGDVMPGHL